VGRIVEWLRATPEAAVTNRGPTGALDSDFTVTIFSTGSFRFEGLPAPPYRKLLLVEHVYPVADGGPVAFAQAQTW